MTISIERYAPKNAYFQPAFSIFNSGIKGGFIEKFVDNFVDKWTTVEKL